MGIHSDSIDREGLGRTGGKVIGGEWSIKKKVSRGRAEYVGTEVIDQNVN